LQCSQVAEQGGHLAGNILIRRVKADQWIQDQRNVSMKMRHLCFEFSVVSISFARSI
jgi:hypothetical protein